MDENKRTKLHQISFRINKSCGLCKFSKVVKGSMFGDCSKNKYQHLKHTGPEKPLSINIFGCCPLFKMDPEKEKQLHGFTEFIAQ